MVETLRLNASTTLPRQRRARRLIAERLELDQQILLAIEIQGHTGKGLRVRTCCFCLMAVQKPLVRIYLAFSSIAVA